MPEAAAPDAADQARSHADLKFDLVVNSTSEGFIVTDRAGLVLWANRAASQFFELTPARFLGLDFGVPCERGPAVSEIEIITPSGVVGVGEMDVMATTWDGLPAYLILIRDISQSTAAQELLAHNSAHDALTGLPSRKLLDQTLHDARQRAIRFGGAFSVIMVKIDEVARITSAFGYAAGEELIAESASRLADCRTATDTLARIDHRTFAFVNEDVATLDQARKIADRIAGVFNAPMQAAGHPVATTVSIGVVHSTGQDGPESDLLRDAQAALRRGQLRDRTSIGAFEDSSSAASQQQFELAGSLRDAVKNDEFLLYYQPIVSNDLNTIHGVEALIRWDRGTKGIVPPGRFLPVAESTGLIVELDAWVLESACRQARIWNDRRTAARPLAVHVNLSACNLLETSFLDNARHIIEASSVDPAMICIELTETTLVTDTDRAVDVLTSLQELGCSVAIDDFGTGFSSFSYLERFPVNVLKIDRSFVMGLGTNYKDGVIVSNMIALARGIGARCVAEGVETVTQAAVLRQLRCEQLQGFLIAKPMPANELTAALETRWSSHAMRANTDQARRNREGWGP